MANDTQKDGASKTCNCNHACSCGCGCGCGGGNGWYGGGHHWAFHILRWILAIVIIVMVFDLGIQIGEFKGALENQRYSEWGGNMMYHSVMMNSRMGSGMTSDAPMMLYSNGNAAAGQGSGMVTTGTASK